MLKIMTLLLLMAAAVTKDIQTYKIPNRLLMAGAVNGCVLRVYEEGWHGFADAAAGALTPLLICSGLFVLSMIGAGDIKLLMVVGSYLGSSSMLRVMGISCVIAAVLSFMKVLVYGIGRKRKRYFLDYCRQVSVKGRIIPYIKKEDMDRNACWLFHLSLPILLAVVFELLWQM